MAILNSKVAREAIGVDVLSPALNLFVTLHIFIYLVKLIDNDADIPLLRVFLRPSDSSLKLNFHSNLYDTV